MKAPRKLVIIFVIPVILAMVTILALRARRGKPPGPPAAQNVQIFARVPQKPAALNKRIAAISNLLATMDGGVRPQAAPGPDGGAGRSESAAPTLRGVVFDYFGNAPGGCTVFIRPVRAGELAQHSTFSSSHRTGGDGVVAVEGLAPGTYDLLARCERGLGRLRNVGMAAEGVSDFGSIRLDGGGALRGTLVESGTKKSIPGASVTIYSPYPNREMPDAATLFSAASDQDGRFEFENVPEGRWQLKIEAAGYLGKDLAGLNTAGRGAVDLQQIYLVKGSLEALHEGSKFGGIGVAISRRKDELKVMSVIDGTPARNAGLEGGDTILEVNGLPASELSIDEAIATIRGDERTSVRLKVKRGERIFETEIVRDMIRPE